MRSGFGSAGASPSRPQDGPSEGEAPADPCGCPAPKQDVHYAVQSHEDSELTMSTKTIFACRFFLIAGLVALAGADCMLAEEPPETRPNIIFIYADDMGWTGSSVEMIQGDEATKSDFYQTPNLEKLAKRGMVFSQAYSPGPMCTPSRAGVLTGLTPAELRITTPGGGRTDSSKKVLTPRASTQLPRDLATTGSTLQAAGYATALLGKWHIGHRDDAGAHGFDLHDGPTQNDSNGTDEDPKAIVSLTRRGIEFMEKNANAGKPFFLQLSHYAVHSPIQSRPSSIDKFNAASSGRIHRDSNYAGMTWDLDTSLAQITEAVQRLGIAENTYIVFMSDNGAQGNRRKPNNTPLFAGKGTLYEGGIRVPLVIVGPGVETGYCGQPVSGTDLFATFAAWIGVEVESQESEDLTPLFTGRQSEFRRRKALFFHYPHYGKGAQTPQTALVAGDWKLLRDWETGTDQLFDLKNDIGESNDVSAKNAERFESMVESLEARLKETDAQLPTKNLNYDSNSDSNGDRGSRRGAGRGRGRGRSGGR